MSTRYGAYFVSQPLSEAARTCLARDRMPVPDASGDAFACISYTPDSPGQAAADWLRELSAGGESLYLGVQANVGWFEYQHWRDGTCLRSLCYNSDSGWFGVTGEPEDWEQELLFTDRSALEIWLADLESEAEREALTQSWNSGRIENGMDLPPANDEITAGRLWRHLRLGAPA